MRKSFAFVLFSFLVAYLFSEVPLFGRSSFRESVQVNQQSGILSYTEYVRIGEMAQPKLSEGVLELQREPELRSFMRDALNSPSNQRVLYEMALRAPESGGLFYATRMTIRCMEIAQFTDLGTQVQTPHKAEMDGGKYLLMSQAAEKLRMKCSSFTPEEISEDHILTVFGSEFSKIDPLISAMNALGSNYNFNDMETMRSQVAEIVKLGDPFLIDDVGKRMVLAKDPESGKIGYQFSGKFYFPESGEEVARAIYLLPCGLGMQCDQDEFKLAIKCAATGACYSGRMDYVRHELANRPGAFDRTMELYREMVEAVKSGDEKKFMH
ncbi:hypothetical protein [Ottowia thiooxydans]|uniref:Secreted protein n=1 Tax=Ottowia thiooxydans TaxID=219182 RepID=A0ABV2QGH8_9BURK